MVGINQFPQLSMKNRHLIEQSTNAGCFQCCKIYPISEIKNYTDKEKTCICPFCNVDSIVGDNCGFVLNEEILKKAKLFWFDI